VAFNRHSAWRQTERERERVLETVDRSLRFLEGLFGPYPLEQLHVATLPRDYSQSYAGFMTLTDSVVRPDPPRSENEMTWFRANTISHEMAHQWWGNLVGWWSYRDQWLSEAMANYIALLYYASEEGGGEDSLADLSAGWKDSLVQTTAEGRTFESLGPVVLGARLNSSVASNGYSAVVYRKGAVVLAMLARAVGEERFLEMLRALVDAAENRVLSTEDFLGALEHMSAIDLQPFARQFIFGTGVPRIYYDYEIDRAEGGGWLLRGEASRLVLPRYDVRLERDEAGMWDLRRDFHRGEEAGSAGLMVPFQVVVNDSAEGEGRPGAQDGRSALRSGQIFLNGPADSFEITFEREPSELRLDPRGEILAYFHSAKKDPRRVGRYNALNLTAEGRLDEAEAGYLRALELPALPDSLAEPAPLFSDPRAAVLRETARIRLALVRLYLDQGRLADAASHLDLVDESFGPDRVSFRVERDALRSRLEILRGQYEPAFRRLKRTLRLAGPHRTDWRAMMVRVRLGSEWQAMIEAYALLAVAAYETGHLEDARWALQEARDRGAGVDALSGLL
jgi:tetratricopeptide (TPR) repeat protein